MGPHPVTTPAQTWTHAELPPKAPPPTMPQWMRTHGFEPLPGYTPMTPAMAEQLAPPPTRSRMWPWFIGSAVVGLALIVLAATL